MVGVTTLLDFILRLLSDPEAAEEFTADPEGTLAEEGLGDVSPLDATNAAHSVTTLLGGPAHVVPHFVPVAVPHVIAVGSGGAAATSADVLQTFVNNYYAETINANNVWADGDVTQAIAAEGGVAVAGGEEAEEINVATGGSVAVSGGVEDSGVAVGGVAAGGDIDFAETDDVVIGDNNVNLEGDNNTVVGDDQVNVSDSTGVNVADEGSTIQVATDGGVNAGGDAIVDSNVAGDDLAVGPGAIATDGNVAAGDGAIATDGNVASGDYAQAAGDDSNLASDDDVFSPTITTTGDVELDFDDSDAISSGNNSGAAADGAVVATGAAIVSQDNDTLSNTTNVGAGATVGAVANSNDIDSNSAVGIGNVAADDQSVAAGENGAAAGHTGGDAQAGAGDAQVANNGSINAGENGVLGDGGVAATDSNVAYTTGDDADAAIADGDSIIAQDDGAVAGGDVFDGSTVDYTNSFNQDSNFTAGDSAPILVATDDSEIEDVDFD